MNACTACLACTALCALSWPALAGGDPLCAGVPPAEYAYAVSSQLERSRDADAVRQVYEREFSRQFRSTYGFGEFYRSLSSVQAELNIGSKGSRALESRMLSKPEVVSDPYANAKPVPGKARVGDEVTVEFFTSSAVGRVRQRMHVACTDEGWKANGIWYLPSAAK